MYAVVDLEGTGGKPGFERIIEVAIYRFDGREIVDQFISLVNPDGQHIPPFVQKLTGIKNKDVRTAPKFHEIAKRIVKITEGAVIVAHNAPFDYRVLREEFARLGYDYDRVMMDTIPLAERFIPDLTSYGLAPVCEALGITNHKRHRADGDALATVELLKVLLEKDRNQYIHGVYLKQPSATGKHSFTEQIEQYVKTTGVYYLFNEQGDVIYIGRSDNLRVRIDRHFLSTSDKALEMQQEVANIKVEPTGSLTLAEIKAYMDLKQLKPKYNEPKDKYLLRRGLFPIQGAKGILWDIRPVRHHQPILQVKDDKEGVWWLAGMCLRYAIRPEDFVLPKWVKDVRKSMAYQERDNAFVADELPIIPRAQLLEHIWPEADLNLSEPGSKTGEHVVFMIREHRLVGYAQVELASDLRNDDMLRQRMTQLPQNAYLLSLVAHAYKTGQCVKVDS